MTPVDQAERLRHLAREDAGGGDKRGHSGVDESSNGGKSLDNLSITRSSIPGGAKPAQKIKKNVRAENGHHHDGATTALRARRASYIAVTSGKGGVGKSNIAVNLSIALAATGRRVTLIDADMGTANADVLCGLATPHNLSHFVFGRRAHIQDVIVEAPGGFTLVPGASGIRQIADLDEAQRTRLIHGLAELERSSELVVIDTNAGISQSVTAMANVADIVLLVITPEPTSIADGYGLIKSMYAESDRRSSGMPQRLAVLVNMARNRTQARMVYDRIAAVARRFLGLQLDFAGFVPHDANVARSVVRRRPFVLAHPKSAAARAVSDLGAMIVHHTAASCELESAESDNLQVTSNGYFNRLSNWLRGRS